jgi:hypothetical protein
MITTVNMPPAAYVLAEGCSDLWVGQAVESEGVTIIPSWNHQTERQAMELWTGKGGADESMVVLTPAVALQLAAKPCCSLKGSGSGSLRGSRVVNGRGASCPFECLRRDCAPDVPGS